MSDLDFELPNGVTLNSVESNENDQEEGIILRKISCPNCSFTIKAIIIDNFGRFTGKIIVGESNEVWHGKLASDPSRSKNQVVDIFNKKVKDHLDKCQVRK